MWVIKIGMQNCRVAHTHIEAHRVCECAHWESVRACMCTFLNRIIIIICITSKQFNEDVRIYGLNALAHTAERHQNVLEKSNHLYGSYFYVWPIFFLFCFVLLCFVLLCFALVCLLSALSLYHCTPVPHAFHSVNFKIENYNESLLNQCKFEW